MLAALLRWAVLLLVAAVILFLIFWRYWFCRQPRREIPEGADAIVSPANGRVAVVRRFDTAKVKARKWNRGSVEFLAQDVARKGWFLLIVMTPLHVHYQRAPAKGEVLSIRYAKGRFHNAVKDPGSLLTLENERNEILMKAARGKLKVVQIAGVLARRITCYARPKDRIGKGELLGFINLGSQVALLLPDTATPTVREGDTVVDGETVVARW